MIRLILVVIFFPPLIALAGLIYSTAFIRSSHYGSYFLYCIVYGFLIYLIFRFSKCIRSSAMIWIPILIASWLGPFTLGHYYGYTDTKFIVWRMVQNDTDGIFNQTWKNMNRDILFDIYVKSVTGNSSGGFRAYLSLMAHEGWSGYERSSGIGNIYRERKGIWVWVAWFIHLIFLLIATIAALGATIPDENQKLKKCQPESKHKKMSVPKSKKIQQPQKNSAWAGGTISTVIEPEKNQDKSGWWLIKASFWGREATFRAYYPNTPPTGRSFFKDIHHALYRHRSEGHLAALSIIGSVEGGLSAKEALIQLMNDDKKIRYVLDSYYGLFENDDKFFSVYFAGDNYE